MKDKEMKVTALAPLLQTAYMQGIKEAVEWIRANLYDEYDAISDWGAWQAKLKEWGLDETKIP